MLEVIVMAGALIALFLIHDLAESMRGRRGFIFRADWPRPPGVIAEAKVRPKGRVNQVKVRFVRVPKDRFPPSREWIRRYLAKRGEAAHK